jgi:hypothetical protein
MSEFDIILKILQAVGVPASIIFAFLAALKVSNSLTKIVGDMDKRISLIEQLLSRHERDLDDIKDKTERSNSGRYKHWTESHDE